MELLLSGIRVIVTGCTENLCPSNAGIASYLVLRRNTGFTREAFANGDKMTNPTPEEISKIIQSGSQIGGTVKTVQDIKFEDFEKRLAQLEKINAELRQANAELYAYAQAQTQVKTQPVQTAQYAPTPITETAQTGTPGQVVSAQFIVPDADAKAKAMKEHDDMLFKAVASEMGYKTEKTTEKDGM